MAQITTDRPSEIKPPSTRPTGRTPDEPATLWRKTIAGLIMAVGAIFLIVTVWQNLFAVGPAFEELTDGFRPILTDEALTQAGADVAGLGAVAQEFESDLFPALSEALGITGPELQGFVGENFPAVATGVAALPEISTTFEGVVSTLGQQQEVFQSADQIPTGDLPATTIPWGLTAAGLLVIGAGALMWWRGFSGAATALVVGILLVAVPLMLSLTSKAADADELNDNLYPFYTAELVAGAESSLQTVGAMGTEMQTVMLPALAEQLEMQPAELNQFLGQFPATAAALQTLPDTFDRFDGMVTAFDANLENYDTMHPVAFSPIIWMLVIGGVVVLALSGSALALNRRGGL